MNHRHRQYGPRDDLWSDLWKWFLKLFDRAVDSQSVNMRNAPADNAEDAEQAQRILQLRAQGDAAAIAELEVLAKDESRTVRMMAQDALVYLRSQGNV